MMKHLLFMAGILWAAAANAQTLGTPSAVGTAFCAGSNVTVTVNASGFNSGNTFGLEMSDGNGNFSQPVLLGQTNGTSLSSIQGLIPKTSLAGIGYRFRIRSTDPVRTSSINPANITVIAAPYLQLLDTVKVCGTSTMLDAGPGLAGYSWNTGATTQTLSVTTAGDYWVTVNNGFCTNTDTTHVNFNHSGIINNDTTLCQGGSMTVNSFGIGELINGLPGFSGPFYYNGHTYFYSNSTTNWQDAKNQCIQLGGHLATIADLNENNFLCQNFSNIAWIGLTDEVNEGQFVWVTGEPFNFSNFPPGEPNNSGNEDYVQFLNGCRWNDLPNIGGLSFWLEFDRVLAKKMSSVWSTGDTTTAITLNPTQSQRVVLTTNNGTTTCTDSLNVTVQNKPSYNLTDTVSLCASSTVLDAGSGYQQYQWSVGSTAQNLTVNQSGVYTSTVVQGACILTDSILVSLNNASIVTSDTTLCSGQELNILTNFDALVSRQNLIAYYPFNQGYQSAIGNYSGTPQGSVSIGNSKQNQNGLVISGKNGGVEIPDFNSNTISVDLWYYYSNNQNDWNTVLCRDGGGQHHILIERNSKQIGFHHNTFFSSGYSLTENTWYHVTLVKNNTNSKLFLDGVLIQNSNSSFPNSQYPLSRIGNVDFNSQGALGIIDEVKIYQTELSQNEINQLHQTYLSSVRSVAARWSTGDTTASLLVQPLASTTYQLTTSNGITTCVDSIRVSVETPKVQLGLSRGTTLCSGDSLVFTATGGTRPLQFMWKQNGNTVDSGLNLSRFRADSSGMYSLITRSPFGCSDTSGNTSITVVQRPGALLTATSSTVGNASPVTLVATPTYPNNVLQYLWKRGNDTLPAFSNFSPNQSSISTTKAGSYVVYITNDGCTDTSNAVVLTANQGGTGSTPIPQLGPAAFHYQAALYNFMGLPLSGKQVRLQFSIADSIQGNPLYREIQSVQTDQRGMVHTSIGNGQALIGNMNNLDWAVPTPRVLVVDVDTLGNGAFIRMGASSLMSVPYAQYARTSGDGRRSVYGIIDHQAQIVQGKGFTISNLGNGLILIHFDEPFQETPQFWISASDGGGIGFYKVMDRQNVQVGCSFVTGSQIQFEAKGK